MDSQTQYDLRKAVESLDGVSEATWTCSGELRVEMDVPATAQAVSRITKLADSELSIAGTEVTYE